MVGLIDVRELSLSLAELFQAEASVIKRGKRWLRVSSRVRNLNSGFPQNSSNIRLKFSVCVSFPSSLRLLLLSFYVSSYFISHSCFLSLFHFASASSFCLHSVSLFTCTQETKLCKKSDVFTRTVVIQWNPCIHGGGQ